MQASGKFIPWQVVTISRDGRVYTVDYEYEVPELYGNEELVEGKHYMVTADVTFLNGGVAGYVDYPLIEHIISIEKTSDSAKSGEAIEISIDGVPVEVKWENRT